MIIMTATHANIVAICKQHNLIHKTVKQKFECFCIIIAFDM